MAVETPLEKNTGRHSSKFAIRYLMAILGSGGLAILYGFKVNVSITLVAMVNHTALMKNSPINGTNQTENSNLQEDGPFIWNKTMQDVILSAYFIGYLISMMPGARMSETLSAKWVMNIAILLNVFASLLSPICAHGHYLLFALMRVIQGIGGGVSFPAMHVMISKWAPPSERGVLTSIAYSGTSLGMVIGTLLSGMIAKQLGWQWVFYIEGLLCLIWCTAWWIMIEDSPEKQQRFISQGEKNYILSSLEQSQDQHGHKLPVPWGKIFTSLPFLAILVAHFCSNFGLYMILTKMPTFLKQVLHLELSSNTLITAFASLCMWIFTPLVSKVLSIVTDKKIITVSYSRKIGTAIASIIPMTCLISVCLVVNNQTLVVVFMTIAVTCLGSMYSGFLANHIDIGPNFAGTLVAITNFFATIPGITVPYIVGALVDEEEPINGWRIVFGITSLLFIIECTFYCIFGSAIEQPWNNVKTNVEEPQEQILPLKERRNS